MNRAALKAIISDLEDACFDLEIRAIDSPDTDVVELDLQRALDNAQQRLDDAREIPKPPSLSLQLQHPCETGCGAQIPLGHARCAACRDYEHMSNRPAPMLHREGACIRCGERGQVRADGVCLLCHDELGRVA